MSTNLLETYGWTLRATLDHRVDPILWTHSSSDVLGFLWAGDATVDVDGDGLADSRELRMFGTSTNLTDTDGDGLSDGAEIQTYGLHALSSDTDGDDLPDGWEVSYGLDALSSAGQDGLYGDPDADGLVNLKEHQLGTSPTNGADPAATDIMVLDYDPENGSLSVEWDSADTYDSYGYALYTQGDELNDPIQSDNGMERPEVEFDELPEDPSGYTLELYAYEGATTNSVAAYAKTNFISLRCPIESITAEVNAETRATSTATSEGTAPTAYVCTSETATVQLTAHEAQGAFPSGAPRWSTGEDSTSTIDVPVPEAGTVSNYWAEWSSTKRYIKLAGIDIAITSPKDSADDGTPTSATLNSFIDTKMPYRYDWQAVVSGVTNSYSLAVTGDISNVSCGYSWTLAATCGTLAPLTGSHSPTHSPPASVTGDEAQGTLTLEVTAGGERTGCKATKQVAVYADHLARDMTNFISDDPIKNSQTHVMAGGSTALGFVCHDSTTHAYKGRTGRTDFWSSWTVAQSNTLTYASPTAAVPARVRGDVICYYGGDGVSPMHSATFSGVGNMTWGANNTALVWDESQYKHTNESWRFAYTRGGMMYELAGSNVFPIIMKVFEKQ